MSFLIFLSRCQLMTGFLWYWSFTNSPSDLHKMGSYAGFLFFVSFQMKISWKEMCHEHNPPTWYLFTSKASLRLSKNRKYRQWKPMWIRVSSFSCLRGNSRLPGLLWYCSLSSSLHFYSCQKEPRNSGSKLMFMNFSNSRGMGFNERTSCRETA